MNQETGRTLPAELADRPALSEALAKARDRAEVVIRGKTHQSFSFSYGSSDAKIWTAQQALEGTGLSVIPAQTHYLVHEDHIWLMRTWELRHSSGESLRIDDEWPVVLDKGNDKQKPLNDAIKAARTELLGTFLRDLLGLPTLSQNEADVLGGAAPAPEPSRQGQGRRPARPQAGQRAPEPGFGRCACGNGFLTPRTKTATGEHFLGCSSYPDCSRTRPMPAQAAGRRS